MFAHTLGPQKARSLDLALAGLVAAALLLPASLAGAQRRDGGDRTGGSRGGDGGSSRIDRSATRSDRGSTRGDSGGSVRRDTGPTRTDTYSRGDSPSYSRRSDSGSSIGRTGRDSGSVSSDPAPRRDSGDRTGTTRTPSGSGGTYERSWSRSGDRTGSTRTGDTSDRTRSERTRDSSVTRTPDRSLDRSYSSDRRRDGGTFDPSPRRSRGFDTFTRSAEGRSFHNGIVLRRPVHVDSPRLGIFFSTGFAYYPYYCPTFSFGVVYYSPYSYWDPCPPYIYRERCHFAPPAVVYVETPIYIDGSTRWRDDRDLDDYYLNRYRDAADPDLRRAVEDLEDSFRHNDIQTLVDLTDPDARVAVYRQGKYQYSLQANDYLDMTRDMMASTDTVTFQIDRIRRRSDDVYSLAGRHTYKDRDGREHTVYVSFVMERHVGHWVITQVNSAPDRIKV